MEVFREKTCARSVRWQCLGALLLGVSLQSVAFDIESMPTPELQKRYDALTHELRCMQCQNQSIADSPVGLAEDLRRDVREQIIAGKTDAEIRDSMVARYGNVILFRPPFTAVDRLGVGVSIPAAARRRVRRGSHRAQARGAGGER